MNSQTTITSSHDLQTTPPSPNKSQRRRGKINIVACDRCKRDKKRCDGNYLTQKACKYCRNHNDVCVYSEPNLLRISRILNTAAKNAAAGEERENDPIQDLQEQIKQYENTIILLASQLENKKESDTTEFIGKLYLSLFANPQISNEQTIILKKLCEMTNNVNSNIDSENINKIRNNLLILTLDDRTEIEKGQSWEELENFVNNNNNNSSDNMIPLTNTNIFGFSYPSGSTTPIPSPQFLDHDFSVTNNQVSSPKKRKFEKNYEPYPSGGHIVIRPKKDTNVFVWHQNDLREDVPIIAFHAPQEHHETETFQTSNVQFDDISSNENLQFSNLLSPNESYGFDLDEADHQFSNITSPTFSNNSFSDDNIEFPTFVPHPSVELMEFFPDQINFNENF
ncbi:hypothetical protein C1645_307239 [Glomus cerebriforme]|uniref:Zn(2)-C6 fungal-type domain-containing protein n=1 Tax=Glomus cerebriforme TaxID=658196 RepID=A0A397TL01_9GLOM|nr:hypothetical protein C1645_307239 [Glomus cerebriforme]